MMGLSLPKWRCQNVCGRLAIVALDFEADVSVALATAAVDIDAVVSSELV